MTNKRCDSAGAGAAVQAAERFPTQALERKGRKLASTLRTTREDQNGKRSSSNRLNESSVTETSESTVEVDLPVSENIEDGGLRWFGDIRPFQGTRESGKDDKEVFPFVWLPRSVNLSLLPYFVTLSKSEKTVAAADVDGAPFPRLSHAQLPNGSTNSIVHSSCRQHLRYHCSLIQHSSMQRSRDLRTDQRTGSIDLLLKGDGEISNQANANVVAKNCIQAGNYEAAILIGKEMIQEMTCKRHEEEDHDAVVDDCITTLASQVAVLCLATAEKQVEAMEYSELAVQALPQMVRSRSSNTRTAHAERTVHVLLNHGLTQLAATDGLEPAMYAWREAIHIAIPAMGYKSRIVAVLLNNLGVLHWQTGCITESVRSLDYAVHVYRTLLARVSEASAQRPELVDYILYSLAATMGNLGLVYHQQKDCSGRQLSGQDRAVSILNESLALFESILGDTSSEEMLLAAYIDCIENESAWQHETSRGETEVNSLQDNSSESNELNRKTTASTWSSVHRASSDFPLDEYNTQDDGDRSLLVFGNGDGVPRPFMGSSGSSGMGLEPADSADVLVLGPLYRDQTTPEQCVRDTILNWFGRRHHGLDHMDRDTSFAVNVPSFEDCAVPSLTDPNKQRDTQTNTNDQSDDSEDALDADLRLSEIYHQAMELVDRDDTKNAIKLFQTTLQHHRRKYGPTHHLVGQVLHNIGQLHLLVQRYPAALGALEEAAMVRSEALGPDHPDLQATLIKIALVHLVMGHVRQAHDALCDIRVKLADSVAAYGHPLVSNVINNIGVVLIFGNTGHSLHQALDLFQEARMFQKQLLDGCLLKESGEHDSLYRMFSLTATNTLSNIGYVYAKDGKLLDALQAYREAYGVMRRHLPMDHGRVVEVTQNIEYLLAQCKAASERETSMNSSLQGEAMKSCFCSM